MLELFCEMFQKADNYHFVFDLQLAKILVDMKEIHIFSFIEAQASSGALPSALHGIESLNRKENFSLQNV